MDTCSACGAKLAPDADWCNQCYTRASPGGGAAPAGRPDAPVTGTSTMSPASAARTSTVPRPPAGRLGWVSEGPEPAPIYSRFKAGPTSFGVVGRTLLTIGLLALGVVGYFALLGNVGFDVSWKSAGIYTACFPLIAVPVGLKIWKPARVR